MADRSEIWRIAMDLLRGAPDVRWVAAQLEETLAGGISMTVRDSMRDAAFVQLEPSGLTTRERRKREKYETTRPYSDEEALELLTAALKELFETLPAVQTAAMERLRSFTEADVEVEFTPPDEAERGESTHRLPTGNFGAYQERLKSNLEKFLSELMA